MKLRVSGEVTVPGDKSITHRALMLAATARGESRLRGLLAGADCRSTAEVLRSLGCEVPTPLPSGEEIVVRSEGLDAWRTPDGVLDCGNSGTTARLMMGWLAGRPFCSALNGDASLRSRPMRRITGPLGEMGARFRDLAEPDRLPVEVCGGELRPLEYRSPKASAQIKSALLFAGLSGRVPVSVHEPILSRDHTERMLRALGVGIHTVHSVDGWTVSLDPPGDALPPLDLRVPGDFSAAAFLIALALLADEGELRIRGVGVNPTRTGLLGVLARMGGEVETVDPRVEAGEPVADLVVRPARLVGTRVEAAEIPALIDEVPILAILAARAEGATEIRGAGELRVKETDRIHALIRNLRALGVDTEEWPDGLRIVGSDRPLTGEVRVFDDHRIAMAFGVLAALPGNQIRIDQPGAVEVSFPNFWKMIGSIPVRPDGVVIAIDGPAGSGKSSTAREVAARLGYRHLDSGAFYRALTLAALRAGIDPAEWPTLDESRLDRFGIRAEAEGDAFHLTLDGGGVSREIRSPEVNAHVSRMAAVPAVRAWLLGALREAGRRGGLVADGRDIGTVVFPDAEVKVFLVCDPCERARRRLREQGSTDASDDEVRRESQRLEERDRTDSTRETAPLARAPGAVLLDTTELSFAEQVEAVVRLARERAGA